MKTILRALFMIGCVGNLYAAQIFRSLPCLMPVTKEQKAAAQKQLCMDRFLGTELPILKAYYNRLGNDRDQLSFNDFNACHMLLRAQYESFFKINDDYSRDDVRTAHKRYEDEVMAFTKMSSAMKVYAIEYAMRARLYLLSKLSGVTSWSLEIIEKLAVESERKLQESLKLLPSAYASTEELDDEKEEEFITYFCGLAITTIVTS